MEDQQSASSKPILYSYFRSSASWRVRIALNWKGIDYEYRAVHLVKDGGQQNTEDYFKHNPMQRVPAYVVEGHTLCESVAICEFLEETSKDKPLMPSDPFKRALVRQLCEIINSGIQPLQNIGVLNKLEEDYGVKDKNSWLHHWINKGLRAYAELIKDVKGKYSVGDEVTLADAFLIPQLYAASRYGIDVAIDYPILHAIKANLEDLPEFKAADWSTQPDTVL